MTTAPLAVLGVPLYNHASLVEESIESLLSQRYPNCRFVAVDDASTDNTAAIVQAYARRDSRLSVERNERRLGMVGNWRRCFEQAVERYPEARYFAWASDHDVWHPRWLSRLVGELERHPEAVLVYPETATMAVDGAPLPIRARDFQTAGTRNRAARMRRVTWGMAAGNMVYGLYRVDALRRAGVYRRTLLPDRLLMAELALYGEFRYVAERLWYRRHEDHFSLARQRRALFAGPPPIWTRVPWWLAHPAILMSRLVARGEGLPDVGRLEALALTIQYAALSVVVHLAHAARRQQRRRLPQWLGGEKVALPNGSGRRP